jgi:serine protease Do
MIARRTFFVATMLLGSVAVATLAQGQSAPPTLRGEPFSYRGVVKSVLPAVVSIDAKVSKNRFGGLRSGEADSAKDLRNFIDKLEKKQPSAPQGDVTIGFGSGFIVDAKGIVLTNYHVIENADLVEITLTDNHKFTSTEIKGDQRTDLAIVRFDTKGEKLTALELADSELMEVGDRVLAIGAPFGLSGSVTAGIISAKGRDVRLNDLDDFIQTDAAINPGNSGGPLVNLDGKVVGVNSAIKSGSGGFQGVSLAISSNMAKGVMVPLIRDGVVKRPYIGIRYNRDPEGQKNNLGVVVTSVVAKAPAEKGGIQANDVIVSINGTPIKKDRDLSKTIANQAVGATIEIGIVRDGKPAKVKVLLEEEPKELTSARSRTKRPIFGSGQGDVVVVDKAGLHLHTLTEEQAMRNGVDQAGGALVYGVVNGSIADKAGMVPGSIILRVNNKTVESAQEAKAAIEEGLAEDGATLQVQMDRKISTVFLPAK